MHIKFLLLLFLALVSSPCEAEIRLVGGKGIVGLLAFTYINNGNSDIYYIDLGAQKIVPLVSSEVDEEFPSWAPDGKTLAYYSDISGDREIYSMALEERNSIRLTYSPGIDEDPDWSPEGKKLVFRSERSGVSNLFTMNKDGSEVARLRESKYFNSVPRWSPDGKNILYSTNAYWPGWDIELLNLETAEARVQTRGIKTFCHAAWRPDGKGFVYSHGSGKKINLWMRSIDGEEKRLTDSDTRDYDVSWLDSDRLFFVRESAPGNEVYQIYLLEISSGEVYQISENTGSIRDLDFIAVPKLK